MDNRIYEVSINTPGRIFLVKGKIVRTPVKFDVTTKQELSLIETKIRSDGISNYEIREKTFDKKEVLETESKKEKVEVRKKVKRVKPKTTLEELMNS